MYRLDHSRAGKPKVSALCLALASLVLVGACTDRAARPAADSVAYNAPAPSPDARDTPAVPDSAPDRSCRGTPGSGVTVYGIGALCAGMTVTEARTALNEAFSVPADADPTGCTYATWPKAPAGVRVMVENGHVARVEITQPGITTTEGAGVGDTEQRIATLYGERVTSSPHKYSDGKYLTVAPMALADSAFRLVFEVEQGKVTKYRSGTRPQVEYVEGCS